MSGKLYQQHARFLKQDRIETIVEMVYKYRGERGTVGHFFPENRYSYTRKVCDRKIKVKSFPRRQCARLFCTPQEYGDYGYLKIKGMANTWNAISRLQIDEIEKIQQGFQEYDFELKISN